MACLERASHAENFTDGAPWPELAGLMMATVPSDSPGGACGSRGLEVSVFSGGARAVMSKSR